MPSYSRKQLLDLRNTCQQSTSSTVEATIPQELRRTSENVQPVTRTYSRDQLVAIRDDQNNHLPALPMNMNLPDELRRPSRFRCDSNCVNEQQHHHKQILKYSRNELLRFKQQSIMQQQQQQHTCAAQTRALEAKLQMAPEIFMRPLGR